MSSLSRYTVVALSVAASAYASPLSTNTNYAPRTNGFSIAPLIEAPHAHGFVNNSYIVTFKDNVAPHLVENHFNFLQQTHAADALTPGLSGIRNIYDGHVKGYSGHFSERVINELRTMPEVELVERDQIVHTTDVQNLAPWGLARISHRPKLGWSTFTKYVYNGDGGEGVDVYVIDTGINIHHVEFEGRASWGKTIPKDDVDEDGNGHGTHCAGTIASRKYGVAKKANVIAVKVLGSNGSGSMADVVSGVLFAAEKAAEKAAAAEAEFAATGKTSHKGSVASMSLGGGQSPALDRAVNKAFDSGLHFAVAAGNDNRDACSYSPAAAENPITVGASTMSDERAYFSNYGKCVDVFGPGLNILSTYIGSTSATATLSGTSMATPHTAGLLAYLLSLYPSTEFNPDTNEFEFSSNPLGSHPMATAYAIAKAALPEWISTLLPAPRVGGDKHRTLTPPQLKKALLKLATPNVFKELPAETPNLLIFNNATSD